MSRSIQGFHSYDALMFRDVTRESDYRGQSGADDFYKSRVRATWFGGRCRIRQIPGPQGWAWFPERDDRVWEDGAVPERAERLTTHDVLSYLTYLPLSESTPTSGTMLWRTKSNVCMRGSLVLDFKEDVGLYAFSDRTVAGRLLLDENIRRRCSGRRPQFRHGRCGEDVPRGVQRHRRSVRCTYVPTRGRGLRNSFLVQPAMRYVPTHGSQTFVPRYGGSKDQASEPSQNS